MAVNWDAAQARLAVRMAVQSELERGATDAELRRYAAMLVAGTHSIDDILHDLRQATLRASAGEESADGSSALKIRRPKKLAARSQVIQVVEGDREADGPAPATPRLGPGALRRRTRLLSRPPAGSQLRPALPGAAAETPPRDSAPSAPPPSGGPGPGVSNVASAVGEDPSAEGAAQAAGRSTLRPAVRRARTRAPQPGLTSAKRSLLRPAVGSEARAVTEPSAAPAAEAGPAGAALASEKQFAFLRALGLTPPSPCPRAQAIEWIVRGQNARFYAWKVARQEFGADLDGRALQPLLAEVLRDGPRAQAIVERMDGYLERLLGQADTAPDPEAADAPELLADDIYRSVRAALLRLHPHLAGSRPPAQRSSVTQEQEVLQRIQAELEPHFYVGQVTAADRLQRARGLFGAAAAAALVVLAWWLWPAGAPNDPEPVQEAWAPAQYGIVEHPVRPEPPRRSTEPAEPAEPAGREGEALAIPEAVAVQPLPVIEEAPPEAPEPAPPPDVEPAPDAEAVAPPAPVDPAQVTAAVTAFELPAGGTLQKQLDGFRERLAAQGWTSWVGQPKAEGLGEGAFRVLLTVSWKRNPEAQWERLECRWKADAKTQKLAPENADAKKLPDAAQEKF